MAGDVVSEESRDVVDPALRRSFVTAPRPIKAWILDRASKLALEDETSASGLVLERHAAAAAREVFRFWLQRLSA